MLTEKYIRSLDNHKIESNFLQLLHYCKKNPELFVQRTIEAIKLFPDKCLYIWKMNFESFTRPNVFIFNYLGENIAKQSTLKSFKLLFYYRKQFKQIWGSSHELGIRPLHQRNRLWEASRAEVRKGKLAPIERVLASLFPLLAKSANALARFKYLRNGHTRPVTVQRTRRSQWRKTRKKCFQRLIFVDYSIN